jgi:hypothetical protein
MTLRTQHLFGLHPLLGGQPLGQELTNQLPPRVLGLHLDVIEGVPRGRARPAHHPVVGLGGLLEERLTVLGIRAHVGLLSDPAATAGSTSPG